MFGFIWYCEKKGCDNTMSSWQRKTYCKKCIAELIEKNKEVK